MRGHAFWLKRVMINRAHVNYLRVFMHRQSSICTLEKNHNQIESLNTELEKKNVVQYAFDILSNRIIGHHP